MGKTLRWLKGLFGINNKKKDKMLNLNLSGDRKVNQALIKEKQDKHTVEAVIGTAAATNIAIAAAEDAAAVVRMTNQKKGTMLSGGRENLAALKIQTVFRGFLAKKALRALKALVKLQARVRGFLVRERIRATHHGMKVLMKVQKTIRAKKTKQLILSCDEKDSTENIDDKSKAWKMTYDSYGKDYGESKIVGVDFGRKCSRSRRSKTLCSPDYLGFQNKTLLPKLESLSFREPRWGYTGDSTTQSTPRFSKTCVPNYMSKTESFRAKMRSQSASNGRVDEKETIKKQFSLNESI